MEKSLSMHLRQLTRFDLRSIFLFIRIKIVLSKALIDNILQFCFCINTVETYIKHTRFENETTGTDNKPEYNITWTNRSVFRFMIGTRVWI